jgi:uncharacterized protein
MKNRRVVQAVTSLSIVALLGFVIAVGNIRAAAASPIVGDWNGALSAGGTSLRLVVHFSQDKDGKLSGTMDSLDQAGANGIVITTLTFTPPDVHFDILSISGTFDGKLSKDNSEIAGDWKQAGQSLPLTLKRAAK